MRTVKLGGCQLVASASSSATPGARFCQSNTNEVASETSFCSTEERRQHIALPRSSRGARAERDAMVVKCLPLQPMKMCQQ
jgi:hypothetical protein